MDDEQKLLKQRDLGTRGERLKNDDLLNAIFEGLRAQYMKEWAQSEPHDTVTRELKYAHLHGLLDVRAQINAICMNGQTAAKFLAEYEKRAA